MKKIKYSNDYTKMIREAKRLANRGSHANVSTIHILLGITFGDSAGEIFLRHILNQHRLELYDLQGILFRTWDTLIKLPSRKVIPYSIGAETVLKHALSIASTQGFLEVGTDHVLWAMFIEDGATRDILQDFNITETDVADQIRELYPSSLRIQ